MASAGWLQGVRSGSILRIRTRTGHLNNATAFDLSKIQEYPRFGRPGFIIRGEHTQASYREEECSGGTDLNIQGEWQGEQAQGGHVSAYGQSLRSNTIVDWAPSYSINSGSCDSHQSETSTKAGLAANQDDRINTSPPVASLIPHIGCSPGTTISMDSAPASSALPLTGQSDTEKIPEGETGEKASGGDAWKSDADQVESTVVQAARLAIQALHPSTFDRSSAWPAHTIRKILLSLRDESVLDSQRSTRSSKPTSHSNVNLQLSLSLLDALRTVRQSRTQEMYEILLTHCGMVKRPDIAATVYVGLVEEWIHEGRIAEGGDVEEFREGGGPKNLMEFRSHAVQDASKEEDVVGYSDAAVRNNWFEGVRSWRFPGEALTPSERLDFWHPKKLALHEKMKNFPIPSPTSPPSLVPEPNTASLKLVLDGLNLTPPRDLNDMEQLELFQRSARAVAMIANTVLSRTLPITAIYPLFKTFRQVPFRPEVYPENWVPPKGVGSDTYPYSAYAHTYRALMSLVINPPSMSSPGIRGLGSLYRLQPMTTKACNQLISWSLDVIRRPGLIARLFRHMKMAKGLAALTTTVYNTIFRRATLMKENKVAKQVQEVLFPSSDRQGQVVRLAAGLSPELHHHYDQKAESKAKQDLPQPVAMDRNPFPPGQHVIIPDEYSLSSYISHLTATSQFSTLEKIVYQLFPFLDKDSYPEIAADANLFRLKREMKRRRYLLDEAMSVSPWIYVGILNGCEKSGKLSLAERVYVLAKSVEGRLLENVQPSGEVKRGRRSIEPVSTLGNGKIEPWFLPIHAYTIMLKLYSDVGKKTLPTGNIQWGQNHRLAGSDPQRISSQMARTIFRQAGIAVGSPSPSPSSGLDLELMGSRVKRPVPDSKFFDAVVSCFQNDWNSILKLVESRGLEGLLKHYPDLALAKFELKMIMDLASNWNVPIRSSWETKLVELGRFSKQRSVLNDENLRKVEQKENDEAIGRARHYLWPEHARWIPARDEKGLAEKRAELLKNVKVRRDVKARR